MINQDAAYSNTIAVFGAGSWGTAVAIHLSRVHHNVILWARDPAHVRAMQQDRQNKRYLPGAHFPHNLHISHDIAHVCKSSQDWIIAVPSHAFVELIAKLPHPHHGVAWLTKGLNPANNGFLSDAVTHKFGSTISMCMIAGPSFAKEVVQGLPTALVLAGNDDKLQRHYQGLLHKENMRVYQINDLSGMQLASAVKNVIAIGCGISDGLGYGANARAALITRGLAELVRLGIKLGAQTDTFYGLAGIGDMVLTCTDNQSRNRRFGLLLGQGISVSEALQQIGQVVEGQHNAEQIFELSKKLGVEMPICAQIYYILRHEVTPEKAVLNLMQRPIL
jgi:glycerol-3-phosphate dehydrogenase (NAD(P)+)